MTSFSKAGSAINLSFVSLLMCSLSVCLLLFGSKTYAWSKYGHVLIAQRAFNDQSSKMQLQLEQLAESSLKLNSSLEKHWKKQFPWASRFASLSAWPDTRREQSLAEIFASQDETLPEKLQSISFNKSARWHYSNRFIDRQHQFVEPKKCTLKNNGQLYLALQSIVSVLQQDNLSDKQKVILLAFLSHLVADAHQPLHNFAKVDARCRHDRGGNRYCLDSRKKCKLNLHAYWDRAAGLFPINNPQNFLQSSLHSALHSNSQSYSQYSSQYYSQDSKSKKKCLMGSMDFSAWQEEALELAEFVYSSPKKARPKKQYQLQARHISQLQMVRAAGRLSTILKEIHDSE